MVVTETLASPSNWVSWGTLACALPVVAVAIVAFAYPTRLARWFERKRLQYEVTIGLYMLTPTEKFIFNSFLFLFLSMTTIASALYLPEHIATIANRVFYYYAGEPFNLKNDAAAPGQEAQAAAHIAVPTP